MSRLEYSFLYRNGKIPIMNDTLNTFSQQFEPPLDEGIAKYVEILRRYGIETCESCQGGEDHAYFEPTIVFSGDASDGWKALAAAFENGLPVSCLRRKWDIHQDKAPIGPNWEIVFTRSSD